MCTHWTWILLCSPQNLSASFEMGFRFIKSAQGMIPGQNVTPITDRFLSFLPWSLRSYGTLWNPLLGDKIALEFQPFSCTNMTFQGQSQLFGFHHFNSMID